MQSFTTFYADGGYFMHTILLAAIISVGLSVVHILTPSKELAPFVVGSLMAIIGIGLMATGIGLIMVFEAIAAAPPDMKTTLLAAGTSIAMNTTVFAMGLAIPATLLASTAFVLARRATATRDS